MKLLQIVGTESSQLTSKVGNDSVSLIDLILKGGWIMIPIALLSIIAIYIIVERILTLKKASTKPEAFMTKVKARVAQGDVEGARLLCIEENTPISRMIEKGLSRIGSPLKNIEVAIENVGKIEIYYLEKNLSVLATISGAAPMIGFLGTVTGMIQAFISIAQEEGSVSPKLLSSGIYEAMITTAAGLTVGIVAYIGYNYLVAQLSKAIHKMEYSSIEFIDLLQESK